MAKNIGVGPAVFNEHPGDEHRLRDRAFAGAGDLEALAGVGGEAVEIQAVVPVGSADERQLVWPKMRAGEPEAAAQMLHERRGVVRVTVKGHDLVQDRPVAGLAQIRVHACNQPQRIVVEAAADGEISLFRERLILVIGAAVRKLRGGDVQDPLSCALRNDMHKAEQVLTRIAEAHPAAHAAFKIAGRAAHVERDHALVLVPDIHHPVDLLVAGLGVVVGEQCVPVPVQRVHCRVKLCRGTVFSDHRVCARLVDHAGRGEFLILRVFHIAETKEKLPRLAGPQRHMELHRADRRPAVDDRIGAAAVLDRFGQRRRAVEADKGVARGIEAVIRAVRPEHGIVIPPLAVFGFVINGVRLQLDLADGEVPLEVGAVVHRVPEAELYIGEHIERLFRGSPIFQRQPEEQAVVALRDQQRLCGRNTIFLPLNHAVAEAVATGIAVQLRFRGLPAGVPDGIAVLDVNMEALLIDRAVVVAVAGQPAQPRVAIEAVAARRIRQECEKILAPQVVDPRQRRARACDQVFTPLIVKETKLHPKPLLHRYARRRTGGIEIV